jgi:hypothetical protein
MPARTLPRSSHFPEGWVVVDRYQYPNRWDGYKDTANLRHDSGNGIVRCSTPYYEEMTRIYEGRQGALETLFAPRKRVDVHVHVCVHGRSTMQ